MAAGDIHCVTIPITVDYLKEADTSTTFVEITPFFDPLDFDTLSSTIVDISGNNSVRKVVITICARQIV